MHSLWIATDDTMPESSLKILVVEDNDGLRKATLAFLQDHGHYVRGVAMAEEINDVGAGFVPDVFVIDLNLPDEDGLSLTRRLRASHPFVGIIITTARTKIGDKLMGYDSGADLYLTKPVDPRELIACVASLGKRRNSLFSQRDALAIDIQRMQLTGPLGTVKLAGNDTRILDALTRAPGHSLERWQIVEIISSGKEEIVSAASLEMRMTRLRKKLAAVGAPDPSIKALHKMGYTLCCTLTVE